ncbi:MAG: hypothetical protein C0433_11925 [Cyclobacterium sp.]|nr:hypothetical protein [Cyclobacterium sp.]
MTVEIGFSRQSSQSFNENHKLGKIRPKSEDAGISRDEKNADPKALSEAIEYRNGRKTRLKNQSLMILGLVILTAIILGYLFFD